MLFIEIKYDRKSVHLRMVYFYKKPSLPNVYLSLNLNYERPL
jgi:hypothetical protein